MIRLTRVTFSLLLTALLLASTGHAYASGEKTMVLVADSRVSLSTVTQTDLRKLYLGFSLDNESGQVTAVRNMSDDLLYEVFLQNVLYMSARTYEQQLASRAVHAGMKRPPEASTKSELSVLVQKSGNIMTFMWEDDAHRDPRLKIIQTLWKGSAD